MTAISTSITVYACDCHWVEELQLVLISPDVFRSSGQRLRLVVGGNSSEATILDYPIASTLRMRRGVIALSRLPGLRHVSVVGCTGVRALAGPDFPDNPCLKVFTRVQLGDDD